MAFFRNLFTRIPKNRQEANELLESSIRNNDLHGVNTALQSGHCTESFFTLALKFNGHDESPCHLGIAKAIQQHFHIEVNEVNPRRNLARGHRNMLAYALKNARVETVRTLLQLGATFEEDDSPMTYVLGEIAKGGKWKGHFVRILEVFIEEKEKTGYPFSFAEHTLDSIHRYPKTLACVPEPVRTKLTDFNARAADQDRQVLALLAEQLPVTLVPELTAEISGAPRPR